MAVLDLLGEASRDMGVREIARQLGLAPSIVHRLIQTLTDRGYLERSIGGDKYRVGYRAFQIGRSYLARSDLRVASLPELRSMAERDQINTYLGVLRDRSIIYLETVQSSGPIAIVSVPGSRTWLHSTALGKALLAELPDDQVAELLGEEPFHRRTDRTKTTLAEILEDLREVRRTGYAICDEENIDGVFAVGAVVRDSTGQAIAAISGAEPRHQLDAARIERLCGIIVAAAQRISRRLGAAPPKPLPHESGQPAHLIGKELSC